MIKENVKPANAKKPLRKKEEAYFPLFIIVNIRTHIVVHFAFFITSLEMFSDVVEGGVWVGVGLGEVVLP